MEEGQKPWGHCLWGVNHLPAQDGPVAASKQNCQAPSAISCLRHMYECRLWLHLITMPFKLHLAHRDTAQVPVASLFTATFLPSSVLLLMKKLQTCRRKNEGLWIQGALDSKSCLIPPSSRNCCVILTISSLTCWKCVPWKQSEIPWLWPWLWRVASLAAAQCLSLILQLFQ